MFLLLGLLACTATSDPTKDSDTTDSEQTDVDTINLMIVPARPTSADDITATWDGHEGATVTWTPSTAETYTHSGVTLPASATRAGEFWTVRVTTDDATGSRTFTVAQAPAPPITVTLTPNPPTAETDNLTCTWAFDTPPADGADSVTTRLHWSVDGFDLDPALFTHPGEVPAAWLRGNETWACHVTVADQTGDATATASVVVRPRHSIPTVQAPAGDFMFGINAARGTGPVPNGPHIWMPMALMKDMEVAVTELTEAQWHAVQGGAPTCGDCAKSTTTWYDFARFLNTLSSQQGLDRCYTCDRTAGPDCLPTPPPPNECSGFRFPSFVEWQYVARDLGANQDSAPNGTFYDPEISFDVRRDCRDVTLSSGLLLSQVARGCAEPAEDLLHVARRTPNRLGLYDITGNVEEYLTDCPYQLEVGHQHTDEAWNPVNIESPDFFFRFHSDDSTSTVTRRTVAGGDFGADWRDLVVDLRYSAIPTSAPRERGLRLVRTLPERPFRVPHPLRQTQGPNPCSRPARVEPRSERRHEQQAGRHHRARPSGDAVKSTRPLLLLGLLACTATSDPTKDSDATDSEQTDVETITIVIVPARPTSADDITATWDGYEGATVTWTPSTADAYTHSGVTLPLATSTSRRSAGPTSRRAGRFDGLHGAPITTSLAPRSPPVTPASSPAEPVICNLPTVPVEHPDTIRLTPPWPAHSPRAIG